MFDLRRDWRWFCCGWTSPLCVADTILHKLNANWHWLCDRHDAAIWRAVEVPSSCRREAVD